MDTWSSNNDQQEHASRPPIPNRSFSGDDLTKSTPRKPLISFSRSTSLVATLPARGLPLPPPLPPLPPEILRRQVPFDSEYIPQSRAPPGPKRRLVDFARGPRNGPPSLPPLPPKPLTRYKSVEKGLNESSTFGLRSNSPPPPVVPPRPVTSHGVQSASTTSDMPPVPPRPHVLINSPVSDSSDDSWSVISPQMTDLPAAWLATTSPSSSRSLPYRSFLPSTSPQRPHTALPSLHRKTALHQTLDSHSLSTSGTMPVPNQPNNPEHLQMDAELKHVLSLSLAESEQTLKAQQQEDEELAKAIAESLALSSKTSYSGPNSSRILIDADNDDRSGSRPINSFTVNNSSPGNLQIPNMNDKSYLDLSSPFEKELQTPASLFLDMDDATVEVDSKDEEELAMQLQQEETRQMAVDILDREDIARRDAQLTRQIHEDARRREEELLERERRDRDNLEKEAEIERARNHLRDIQEQRDAELARLMSKWEQTGPTPESIVPSPSQSPPHLLTQPFSSDDSQAELATSTVEDETSPTPPPKLPTPSHLSNKTSLTMLQNPAPPSPPDQQDVSVSRSHSGSSTIGRESAISHLHQPSPGWSREPSPGPRGVSASPGNHAHNDPRNHNGNTSDNADDELADLKGFSYGFTPPNIPVSPPQASAPCAPFPDIINLSPAPYPPFNIMAPSWRHLLRLLARQETRVQAHIDVIANRKEEQQLRVVVQFVKLAYTANTWRTIIYLSLDEPFPPTVPASATARFTNGDTTVLPYSYAISDHGRSMTGPNMHIYAIPLSPTSPFPILPITFPNIALYLQSAMKDSRARKVRHDSFRRLAKIVQSCYPEEVVPPTQEERKPSRGVGNLFKRVVGRGSNDKRDSTGNEDVFDMITPFRLDHTNLFLRKGVTWLCDIQNSERTRRQKKRINGVSALLSSCLMALLAAIALSSLAIQSTRPEPQGRLNIKPIKVQVSYTCDFVKGTSEHLRGKQDFAFFQFDFEGDLTSLFDYNTKQLFLYLTAEYYNAQGVKNNVVLWDRIIRRKKDAKLRLKGIKPKYRFREISKSFTDASAANFTLNYNSMPWVGLLTTGHVGQTEPIPFPPAEDSI
ncbi:hypothetical protein Clacol_000372 [Clathrus columnatus]|uniref:Signal peptidase complex subunit 3 n=1 Tax=Clathrus columnatus TaxID=1419009 RepID=A0AAV4ZYE4_9AGAM|nr:hypothetical protein Clacol_000372 [Clathrus columnatus]